MIIDKEENFNNKIIRVFTTHEGSGLGSILNQVKEICLNVNILDALAIQGSLVKKSKNKVEEWV